MPTTLTFNCRQKISAEKRVFYSNGYNVDLIHLPDDPANTNRIRVQAGKTVLEILPSKGFSLAQAWIDGKSIFWEAPIGVPDTDELDLFTDEVWINGHPAPGFTFLKTFCAGVEFYGLRNWGMPREERGELLPLHGETSNIPVEEAEVSPVTDGLLIQASYIYRKFSSSRGVPWFQQGEPLYRVTVGYLLFSKNGFSAIYTIENLSDTRLTPDWGFHITLKPEPGSKLLLPSEHAEERSGNPLPADIETWYPALDNSVRTETGIVHKRLLPTPADTPGQRCALQIHPSGHGILIRFPATPYLQTWFCNGGAGNKEFTLDGPVNPLFLKNWDGQGIEIGSSPLDHNGNIDKTVPYKSELQPREKKKITLNFSVLTAEHTTDLAGEISKLNAGRSK